MGAHIPLKYYILPFIAVYRFMVNLITKKERLTSKKFDLKFEPVVIII